METRRTRRLADVIHKEVANLLLRNLADPSLRWVTITRVNVTRDLRQAVILYSCIDEDQLELAAKALQRAKGLIRSHLGRELHLRHVPELEFKFDKGLHHSYRILDLLEREEERQRDTDGEAELLDTDEAGLDGEDDGVDEEFDDE